MSAQNSPRPLKRDHDSFEELGDPEQPLLVTANLQQKLQAQDGDHKFGSSGGLTTPPILPSSSKRDLSPARSISSSLSDVGPVTPSAAFDSPMVATDTGPNSVTGTASPSAFAALNGAVPPPAKKTKLTFAEKEMRQIQKKIREQEKVEERARKEAERQVQAEERARREAEKAEERAKKEAEKEAEKKRKEIEREEKRLAQQAEKAAREEKKKQKEEEKRQAELEKKKKEGNQSTLSTFFPMPSKQKGGADDMGRGSTSPARKTKNASPSTQATPATKSETTADPSEPELSPYDKLFPGFFVFKDVKLASANRFRRDEEALHSVCQSLDSYMFGDRSLESKLAFDVISKFHLPDHGGRRGKRCMPVRQIMAELSESVDPQESQVKSCDLLNQVPMKFLKFREDVRPPYRGTYTSIPVHGVTRLGRNPLRRDLPNTNYDYDSEAEWVEDEDAEDCNSDDEEEEDGEDGEDMEGFLDDENDELARSKRTVVLGELEPVSSGLCWEDNGRRSTDVKMVSYRMEMIIDPYLKSVDPFSTQYWEPNPSTTAMDPPRLPLTVVKPPNASTTILPSSTTKPVTSFFPPITTSSTASSPSKQPPASGKDTKPKKLLPGEDLPKFKEAVEGNNLSKIGLIEVLKKQFPGRPAAAIKGTLETIAKRVGAKEAEKRWVIIEGM